MILVTLGSPEAEIPGFDTPSLVVKLVDFSTKGPRFESQWGQQLFHAVFNFFWGGKLWEIILGDANTEKTEFGLYPGISRNLKKMTGMKVRDCSPMNGAPGGNAEGGCLGPSAPWLPDRSVPEGCVVKWGAITTDVLMYRQTDRHLKFWREASLPCEVLLYQCLLTVPSMSFSLFLSSTGFSLHVKFLICSYVNSNN